MNRLVLSILISLLAGCATPSPVRQFFDQQNFQYPVEIAPARSKTPLLADINSEPAERLAPEHESFFAGPISGEIHYGSEDELVASDLRLIERHVGVVCVEAIEVCSQRS